MQPDRFFQEAKELFLFRVHGLLLQPIAKTLKLILVEAFEILIKSIKESDPNRGAWPEPAKLSQPFQDRLDRFLQSVRILTDFLSDPCSNLPANRLRIDMWAFPFPVFLGRFFLLHPSLERIEGDAARTRAM